MTESLDLKMPLAIDVKKGAPTLSLAEEAPFRPSISLDTILNQEMHSLTSDIKNIMQSHCITYTLQLPPRLPLPNSWQSRSCFSDFVNQHVTPVSVQEHVEALSGQLEKLIPAPPGSPKASSSEPLADSPMPSSVQTSKPEVQPPQINSSQSSSQGPVKEAIESVAKSDPVSAEIVEEAYSPSQIAPEPSAKSQKSISATSSGTVAGPGTASTGTGLMSGSLIGQLKPEVFSSLVEIFKDVTKNTVKFYIYSGDEGEESTVCKEIKVQLFQKIVVKTPFSSNLFYCERQCQVAFRWSSRVKTRAMTRVVL